MASIQYRMPSVVSLMLEEVPHCWRKSNLFRTLQENDDGSPISVLESPEIVITSMDDLFKFMELCHYWCIDVIPDEIFEYALEMKTTYKGLPEGFVKTTISREIDFMMSTENDDLCKSSAFLGFVDTLAFAHKKGMSTSMTIAHAILGQHLKCFQYTIENKIGHPYEKHWFCRITDLECLDYIYHKFGHDYLSWFGAVENGNLDVIKYLRSIGLPWYDYVSAYAVKGGQLECLKYLHENGCPWSRSTYITALEWGQLECLIYAYENGCPTTDEKLEEDVLTMYRFMEYNRQRGVLNEELSTQQYHCAAYIRTILDTKKNKANS